MDVRGGGLVLADQLAFRIHFRVVLVAVMTFRVLLSPAGLAVFLTASRSVRIKFLRPLSRFDILILLTSITLPGSIDKASVNDAALMIALRGAWR